MKYVVFIVVMMATAVLILFSGFTLPTVVALLIFILAISLDFLTTWLCLRMKGREGNPLMAFMFRKVGIAWSFGLMALLWVVVILTRFMPAVAGVQTAIALVYWYVPLNNIVVLRRLRRKAVVV